METSKSTVTTKSVTTKNAFVPRSAVTVKMTSSSSTARKIGSNSVSRSSAPMVSSAKQNREKEKKEFQDLNQRFAKYIEKVRFLEAQNKKLVKELETLRGSWGKETREIKERYQTELAESRGEVDETLRQKAQLEIKVQSVQEDKADVQHDYNTLKKDFEKLAKTLQEEHTQIAEYESEVGLMRRRVGFLDEENGRLKKKTADQAEEITKLRALVDSEQLGRVHSENRVRSLEEELDFLKSVHDQEMKELGALAYRDTTAENREYWKSELAVAIRDLQTEYETKVDMIKSELETNYTSKISQIHSGNVRSNLEMEQSKEETKKSRDRLQALRNQLLDLERQVSHWKSLYEDKMTEAEENERKWDMQMNQLQTSYAEVEDELERVRAELDEILDAKLSMELEIAAYRRLLEGDQTSLRRCVDDWMRVDKGDSTVAQSDGSIFGKIIHQVKDFVNPDEKQTSAEFTSQRSASQMSIKTTVHKTSTGNLTVDETSPDNSYAVIRNKGDKAEKMDGIVLRRTVDGKEDVHYKFKNLTLSPGKTVRLVAKTFKGKTHSDYVFEGDAVGMGKNVVLSLFNEKGEEQASLVMKNIYG